MPHITELYLLMSNNRSFCLSQIDKFIETKWTISDDQSLKGEGKKITKAGEVQLNRTSTRVRNNLYKFLNLFQFFLFDF